jgi:hypothetical protein
MMLLGCNSDGHTCAHCRLRGRGGIAGEFIRYHSPEGLKFILSLALPPYDPSKRQKRDESQIYDYCLF